jgi:hypothetical protein
MSGQAVRDFVIGGRGRGWVSVQSASADLERVALLVSADVGYVVGFKSDYARPDQVELLPGAASAAAESSPGATVTPRWDEHNEPDGGWTLTHLTLIVGGPIILGAIANAVYDLLRQKSADLPASESLLNDDRLDVIEAEQLARWVVCAEFHDQGHGDCHACNHVGLSSPLSVVAAERREGNWTVTLLQTPWRYRVQGITGRAVIYTTISKERIGE